MHEIKKFYIRGFFITILLFEVLFLSGIIPVNLVKAARLKISP